MSDVIENEPYRVVIALNGYIPLSVEAESAQATISVRRDDANLADLIIERHANGRVPWCVTFAKSERPED